MLSQYDEELFDDVYNEMMNFSGLDTQFINNVLDLGEEDDEMYEILIRWFRSTSTAERKYFEEQMTSVLVKNNLL